MQRPPADGADVTVPSVVGQARADAEAMLNGTLGFALQETFVDAGASRTGRVVSQTPASGTARKGSIVQLVIGL